MKKLRIFLLLFIAAQFSLVMAKAQPEPVEYSLVDNYFLKTDVKLVSGFNCWAATTQAQFNKLFAPAKTAGNTIVTPKFGNQMVIALAMPATMRKTTVIMEKVEMAGSIIYVHCRISYGENLTYKMQPLAIATVDRMSFIKTIGFYNSDNKLIKAIPVK